MSRTSSSPHVLLVIFFEHASPECLAAILIDVFILMCPYTYVHLEKSFSRKHGHAPSMTQTKTLRRMTPTFPPFTLASWGQAVSVGSGDRLGGLRYGCGKCSPGWFPEGRARRARGVAGCAAVFFIGDLFRVLAACGIS